jgi:26S proteasome regulatory subunit N2
MAHFLSLAITPQVHIGLDSNFNIVKNFSILSKAKASIYGYPEEKKEEEKIEKQKIPAAILSSTTRMLAKKKSKLGTNTSLNTDMQMELDKHASRTDFKPIVEDPHENKADENKKLEESKEKEKAKEEPTEVLLSNPCRILPQQRSVICFPPDQVFAQASPVMYTGIILLKKIKQDAKTELFDLVELVPSNNNNKESEINNKDGYSAVQINEDSEMPEEFDIEMTNQGK